MRPRLLVNVNTIGLVGVVALGLTLFSAATCRAATPKWEMLAVSGPTYLPPKQSEIQKLIVEADGGTFSLTLAGSETTAPIPFAANAAVLQSVLESLPSIGQGSVTVKGGPGGDAQNPYYIEFVGSLANQDVGQLDPDSSGLSGPNSGAHAYTPLQGGAGTGQIAVDPVNVGGAATSGEYEVRIGPLPEGIVLSAAPFGEEWTCTGNPGENSATCSSEAEVPGLAAPNAITVPIEIEPSIAVSGKTVVSISGGSSISKSIEVPLVVSMHEASNGAAAFLAGFFDEDGNLQLQAGSHPFGAVTLFLQNTVRSPTGRIIAVNDPKDLVVDLPHGSLGNPLATPRCLQRRVEATETEETDSCNKDMKVGRFVGAVYEFGKLETNVFGNFYNDVPAFGSAGQFATKVGGFIRQSLLVSVRSAEDYGVRISAPNISVDARLFGGLATFDGFPEGAGGKAFLRNPTSCGRAQAWRIQSDTWQSPGLFSPPAEASIPPITGCDELHFVAGLAFQPSTLSGSSGTGATVDLHIPQDALTDPKVLANPDLKQATVEFPPGVVINPSAADGLQGCSEQQIGFLGADFPAPNPVRFSEELPACPDGSKLGSVEVDSPLVEAPLAGTLYMAAPNENPFGSLLAVYLVVDDARSGVVIKLPGELRPDPVTGQLTATFDNSPQLPFEDLKLNIRGGGPRSPLTTPEVCGHYQTTGSLTPWSAPESGPPIQIAEPGFDIASGCSSAVSSRPFAPTFEAGTSEPKAGAYRPLVVKIGRRDGEQELNSLDFTLPRGLIGKLAGIGTCSDAAIAAAGNKSGRNEGTTASCPASSRIGSVDIAAGVGPAPFHVGGSVYLAGPYKGAPLSVAVITPAVAGPFDLGNVVTRAAISVDPETAALTVRTDQIPSILQGIPLKLRSIVISVDRPDFTLNPTSCAEMSATASIRSTNGASASPASRFQVGQCRRLKFTPNLKVSLKGRTRRGGHPALTAVLKQPADQANIARVSVALPRSEFLEQAHIRTVCTRVQFAAEECPKGSIYGYAEALTPLLDQPLKGPVYLRSSSNQLPDLIAALRGPASQPIELDLDGRIDSVKGGIRTTFESVPDAPVRKFVLRLRGGKKGLLVNSTNICDGVHRAVVRMKAQNNRLRNFAARLRPGCGATKKRHR